MFNVNIPEVIGIENLLIVEKRFVIIVLIVIERLMHEENLVKEVVATKDSIMAVLVKRVPNALMKKEE